MDNVMVHVHANLLNKTSPKVSDGGHFSLWQSRSEENGFTLEDSQGHCDHHL